MALHKDRGLPGINAAGQIQSCCGQRVLGQQGWIMGHGDGMQIHHTKKSVMVVLQIHPIANRPQPVAQMQSACGLNA
jgi:hypothetical protein